MWYYVISFNIILITYNNQFINSLKLLIAHLSHIIYKYNFVAFFITFFANFSLNGVSFYEQTINMNGLIYIFNILKWSICSKIGIKFYR